MFRLTGPMRGIFSTSRLPIRIAARQQQGQLENVQKVKVKPRGITFRGVAMSAISIYIMADIYGRLVLDPLEKGAAEALDGMPEPEDEEEDAAIFIPFPGTAKQLKPRPYRGTDPEWIEFVKFSKDKTLQSQVRDELVQIVQKIASSHPMIVLKVGKDIKPRRCWLDVEFPATGPPEFVRSGIEISDERIGWVTNPVDANTIYKIRSVLWPSAMAVALWNFTKVLVVDDTKRLANFLGIQTSAPPLSIEQMLSKQQEMLKGTLPNKKPGLPSPPSSEAQAANNAKAMIQISDPAKATLTSKDKNSEEKAGEEKQIGPGTKIAAFWRLHFNSPIMAMKTKMAQLWRPAPSHPPRGSIFYNGMVEYESRKAYLTIDVKAAWDPQTKEFDMKSLVTKLRKLQPKTQSSAR